MKKTRIAALFAAVTLMVGACDQFSGPETEKNCDPNPQTVVTTTIQSVVQIGDTNPQKFLDVYTDDVLLVGSAIHADNLAIRELIVAGVNAENFVGNVPSFNFDRWEVVLPFSVLNNLPRSETDPQAVIVDITAVDACGFVIDAGSYELRIDDAPGIRVEDLDLDIDLPNDQDFIPADGSLPAILNLSANPAAAGATVNLSASSGAFISRGDTSLSSTSVTLALNEDGSRATASLFFTGTSTAGGFQLVQITAVARDLVASSTINVAGPPRLIPDTLTLDAGLATSVTVQSQGREITCIATPVIGVSATGGGQNLMGQPVTLQTDPITLLIDVDSDLAQSAFFSISCTDAFGQLGTGNYNARAAQPDTP